MRKRAICYLGAVTLIGILVWCYSTAIHETFEQAISGRLEQRQAPNEESPEGPAAGLTEFALRMEESKPDEALNRVEAAKVGTLQIRFINDDNLDLRGSAELYRVTEETRSRLKAKGASGRSLLGGQPEWSGEVLQPDLFVPKELVIGSYLFIARVSHAFQIARVVEIRQGPTTLTIPLKVSQGIRCKILDNVGAPLQDVEVRLSRSTRVEVHYGSEAEELEAAALYEVRRSDATGAVEFPSPFPFLVRLHVVPPPPLAERIVWDINDGATVEITLARGFPISGVVLESERLDPIVGCRLAAYIVDSEGYQVPLCGTATDEEGRYSFEAVDPTFGEITVFAEKPGYECKLQKVIPPLSLLQLQLDFRLARAMSATIAIQDSDGRAIDGVRIHMDADGDQVIPYTFVTDAFGHFVTGAHLVENREYQLEAYVGGIRRMIGACGIPQQSDGVIVVRTQEFGRLRVDPVEASSPATLVELELQAHHPVMIFQWENPSSSVWLPTGRYRASAFSGEELLAIEDLLIKSGEESSLVIKRSKAALSFFVPEDAPIESVSVFSSTNLLVWSAIIDGADYQIMLPIGSYYLSIGHTDGSIVDSEIFRIGAEGLSLGAITRAIPGSASLIGRLILSEGNPAAGYQVFLSAITGYRTPTVQTDLDGSFRFVHVPVGDYSVTVDVPNGAKCGCRHHEETAYVWPAGATIYYSAVLPPSAEVEVRAEVAGPTVSRAFRFAEGRMQWFSLSVDKRYSVPGSSSDFLTGCLQSNQSHISVIATTVVPGQSSVSLSSAPIVETELSWASEFLHNQAGVDIELNGYLLGSAAYSYSGGVKIRHPPVASLVAVIRFDNGSVRRIRLPSSGGSLEVGSGVGGQQIRIVPPSDGGSGLILVQVRCCGVREAISGVQDVALRCDQAEHELLIESSRTVMVADGVRSGEIVHLVSEASLSAILIGEGLVGHPRELRVEWDGGFRQFPVVDPAEAIQVSDLPAIEVTFSVFDSAGMVLRSIQTVLSTSGPAQIRI